MSKLIMLRLPRFEYQAPNSIAEAVALKAECGDSAMFVSGGTDLFPNMKRRQFTPKKLISLRKLAELRNISLDDSGNGLMIGSGVSLSEVAEHPEILKNIPALAKAASLVSAPQLRNMGTIGGNLCLDTRCNYYNQTFPWRKALGFCLKKPESSMQNSAICWVARSSPKCLAVSSSDCAPVMIVLDAEFHLMNPDGKRIVPAGEFYKNDGMDFLNKNPDELLVSIHFSLHEGWKMNYRKLRRREAIDFPVLGVAVAFRLDISGNCVEARIALGAVASCPLRAFEAEKLLVGGSLTGEGGLTRIANAAQVAAKLAKPMDNTDITLGFRKKMATQFVAETIKEVLK